MKYCPRCNARFDDSNSFCLNDGSLLFGERDEQETFVSSNRKASGSIQSPQHNFLKYIIFGLIGFIGLAIVTTLVLWKSNQQTPPIVSAESPNSADNVKLKEKELELREKELTLKQKEKELETKTPEVSQKQTSSIVPVERPLPPSRANSSSNYSGSINNSGSTFSLSWNKNRTVTGSFYYNGMPNLIYTLSGTNFRDGEADIKVYDGTAVAGTIKIYKNIGGNKVCWSGSFYQSDGATVPVSFCRYR